MNYVNIVDHCISECPCVHLERVSLWDKFLQFNPDVYILHRVLDKETPTNVFQGEALTDLVALLSADLALFRYLCLPAHVRIQRGDRGSGPPEKSQKYRAS